MLDSPRAPRSGRPGGGWLLLIAALGLGPASSAPVGPLPATDADLAAFVARDFERDPALRGRRLEVSAESGVVRLTGSLPTLLDCRRALRRAAACRGVLAVENLCEVATRGASDATVSTRLSYRLSLHNDLRPRRVNLEIRDGAVRATGQVSSPGRRLFLEEIIAGTDGVTTVDTGDVRIELEDNETRPEVIVDRVKAMLASPLRFPISGTIEVSMKGDVLVLSGDVPRLIDRIEAADVARFVAGVREIEDLLVVRPELGRAHVTDAGTLP